VPVFVSNFAMRISGIMVPFATTHFHLVPNLRTSRDMHPLRYMPPWCAEG